MTETEPELDELVGSADLRLFPAAAMAWATAFLVPVVSRPTVVALLAVLVTSAATAVGWWARAAVRTRWFAPAGVVPGRTGWAARVAGAGGVALLVASAVGTIALVGLDRANASSVDELAAEGAVAHLTLRLTGDPQLVRSAVGPPGAPELRTMTAVITEIDARGRRSSADAPVLVLTSDPGWTDLLPSTRVQATGRLGPPSRVGRQVAVVRVTTPPDVIAPATALQRLAGLVRSRLRQAVSALAPDPRGLIPGLVVGDESLLPDKLLDDAKTSGLTHLTAVSGTNVSIVLAVVLTVARWAGARAYGVVVLGLLAVGAFVVLARPEPSVLRAGVMGVAVVLALPAGGRRRRLSPVLVATVALLLVDPWLARSYGFALSVVASASIVVLVPAWVARWSRRIPGSLASALAVPLAASVACAPLIVLLSDQVSLVAVLANLLAAPAVAPATILGVVVAGLAPVWPWAAQVVAELAGFPAMWIAWVAHWSAGLPYAAIPWPGSPGGALLLGVVTVVAFAALRRLARSRVALSLLVVPLLVAVGVQRISPGWPPPGWRFVACDVGQGDALVLDAGNGTAVVVDAGPEPDEVDDCLDDLGVRDVALALVTHAHVDHSGGLAGVASGRAMGASGSGDLSVEALPSLGDLTGQPAIGLSAPGQVQVGRLRLQVLWPTPNALAFVDPSESRENDLSLVVLAEYDDGLRILLTGDVEPSAQRALLRAGVDLRADILKVPHHGSRYQDPKFLTGAGASVAVVSVGADNLYGHPSMSTLDLIEATGIEVLRTDLLGDIAIGGVPGRLWTESHHD